MYTMRPAEFEYHRPTSLDEALSLLAEGEDSTAARRGPLLAPDDEAAPGDAGRARRPGPDPGLDGISGERRRAHDRRARHPRSGGGIGGGDRDRARHSGDGGDDRRPAGPQLRHDRREHRARRPGRRLPDRPDGARRDDQAVTGRTACARSRPTTSSAASSPRRSRGELVTSVTVPATSGDRCCLRQASSSRVGLHGRGRGCRGHGRGREVHGGTADDRRPDLAAGARDGGGGGSPGRPGLEEAIAAAAERIPESIPEAHGRRLRLERIPDPPRDGARAARAGAGLRAGGLTRGRL